MIFGVENRDVEKDRLAKFMETDGYSKPAEEELLKQVQLQREEARSKEEDMDLIDMRKCLMMFVSNICHGG